ncbi:MAG TPA: ATP-dependent DNA helicase, partial [Gemmataceae bacterium]|nr:ATP-dependent DNA helicase [Gemmataceae bacterium]
NVQTIDLLEDAKLSASDEWRGGSPAADEAWPDSGFTPRRRLGPARVESNASRSTTTYVEGMMVRHDQYGVGRVTAVSGYGSSRKVKIRFSGHGEKTFIANKAKLAVVRRT